MPSPHPNNEKNSSEDAKKSSSSWFGSWFEHDNANLKEEIHHKLNEYDDYQRQNENSFPFFGVGSNGMADTRAAAAAAAPAAVVAKRVQPSATGSLQQEIEEFFESAGLGGIANHHPFSTSSSSTSSSTISSFRGLGGSGHYQVMRQENQNGVQIDVQFPRAIQPETVAVEVLQESPCVVQWSNTASNSSAAHGTPASTFRDRARLGNSIDCSRLSASIASAQNKNNVLTVKAPRYASASNGANVKPRVIPVTEQEE